MTPETFDLHLSWIRSYLCPLTPDEFGDVLDGKCPPPPRACLVTFDDGWHDNLTHALPLLHRHEVSALLFATVGYIGTTNCFWQERLARMLFVAWKAGPNGQKVLDQALAAIARDASAPTARRAIRDVVTRHKLLPVSEIDSLLLRVVDTFEEMGIPKPTDFGDDRFLSWADLQTISSSGRVTIGSHGVSHSPLPQLSNDLMQKELVESRELLSTKLDCQVDWFAYPNGDFNSASIDLVRATGYRGAFTTACGPIVPGQEAFSLRRVNMHEGSTRTLGRFFGRIAGIL